MSLEESANKQKQSALRLVEVCYEFLHIFIFISWRNYYLRACMQRREIVSVKIADDVQNGINGRQDILLVVRFPLVDMQLFLGGIGILGQFTTHVIEAFKRSDTCGSYGNYFCIMF